MSTFSKNLNHHWKCREQEENSQAMLVLIFWNFTILQYKSDSPQVQGNLIPSIANLVYKLSHELLNDLRKLGNIRKISNLGGYRAQCLVSLQELRLCKKQLKNTEKQIPNFSFPLQFFRVFPFCSKYFGQDCRISTKSKSWLEVESSAQSAFQK